jgi:glycosidase
MRNTPPDVATLRGNLRKRDYIEGLGVTGLWINPSPRTDR